VTAASVLRMKANSLRVALKKSGMSEEVRKDKESKKPQSTHAEPNQIPHDAAKRNKKD
jgi:hypothetical protein